MKRLAYITLWVMFAFSLGACAKGTSQPSGETVQPAADAIKPERETKSPTRGIWIASKQEKGRFIPAKSQQAQKLISLLAFTMIPSKENWMRFGRVIPMKCS
jgi:hypothetical protein